MLSTLLPFRSRATHTAAHRVYHHQAKSPVLLALLAGLTLSACATAQNSPDGIYDPIEPVNRQIFAFNDVIDENALEPAAELYRDTFPEAIRNGIANVLRNLRSPIIIGNQVLQGDLEGAGNALVRFVTNTLGGLGGFLDPASENGFEFEDEDFGQTLAVWGVGEGPYLVLPLLGPSNLRDTVGFVVDSIADPVGILVDNQSVGAEVAISRSGSGALGGRAEVIEAVDEIKESSIDYYASLRNLYNQRRQSLIADGVVSVEIPDFNADISFNEEEIEEDVSELNPSILLSARPAERVED
ncbi:MAG: VacJ family lipoprotein [Pseudomonadota bacterium]